MEMTLVEIRERYKRMDPAVDRCQVLAELNDCSRHQIRQLVDDIFGVGRIDQNRIVALHAQGKTDTQISRALHTGDSTISYWRQKKGLPSNAHKVDYTEMRRLYDAGNNDYEIAQAIGGISAQSVLNWRKRNGLKSHYKPQGRQSTKCVGVRAEEAVRMYASGMTAVEIARRFGVVTATVTKVLREHGVTIRGRHGHGDVGI